MHHRCLQTSNLCAVGLQTCCSRDIPATQTLFECNGAPRCLWTSIPPLPLYNLILTVVILHELLHAFTKHLFGSIITPGGLGPTGLYRCGESGWLLDLTYQQL